MSKNFDDVDGVEGAWFEHLRGSLAVSERLHMQAGQLCNVSLLAMAVAMAIGAKVLESHAGPTEWGAAGLMFWFAGIVVMLTLHCIPTRPRPFFSSDAAESYGIALAAIQGRCALVSGRNQYVAVWLDRCQHAAAAAPAVFVLAGWLLG